MGPVSPLLQLPLPADSYKVMYRDQEHYVDMHTSASQSPINSQFVPYSAQDLGLNDFYPSPKGDCDADSPTPQDSLFAPAAPTEKVSAKRKRENRYKNASPSVLSRRRAQNRASQRAYRERKDQRIKDLEQQLHEAVRSCENYKMAFHRAMDLSKPQPPAAAANLAAALFDFPAFGGGGGGGATATAPSSLPPGLTQSENMSGLSMQIYGYPDVSSYGRW